MPSHTDSDVTAKIDEGSTCATEHVFRDITDRGRHIREIVVLRGVK